MSGDAARPRSDHDLPESLGLRDLVALVLDGAATAEQQVELAARLSASEEARRLYRRYINLHVALKATLSAPTASEPETAKEVAQAISASSTTEEPSSWPVSLGWIFAVALAAFLLAYLGNVWWQSRPGPEPPPVHGDMGK